MTKNVEKVTGYYTSDKRFFLTMEEAIYEEELMKIVALGRRSIQITQQNLPAFLDFIEENALDVANFCHAVMQNSSKNVSENENEEETFNGTNKKSSKT